MSSFEDLFVRGVGLAFIAMSVVGVVAVILFGWFLFVELPEMIELGWSLVESADALTRAIEQHGGAQ